MLPMRTPVSTRWVIPNQRFPIPTDSGQKEREAGWEGEIELADLVGLGKAIKIVDGVVAAADDADRRRGRLQVSRNQEDGAWWLVARDRRQQP